MSASTVVGTTFGVEGKQLSQALIKHIETAMEQNLIYTRLGNPLGQAELAEQEDDGTRAAPKVRSWTTR